MSTLSGLKNLLSDSNTASILSEFRGARGGERLAAVETILYGGYAYQFYRAIEQAKIALSTAAGARSSTSTGLASTCRSRCGAMSSST